MDASLLATDLDNLETFWSSLDWWLDFWTILVVVGVAMELLVIITEYAHDWRDFKRGIIHSPDKPSIVIFSVGFLGAALVAIGVAGELRIHVKAGKIESYMRSKSRELISIANREAGDANKKAGEASERSEALRKENLALQVEVLRLRLQMTDRHFSKEQRARLTATLLPFSGQTASFVQRGDNPEAGELSRELLNILSYDAHWKAAITAILSGPELPEDRAIVVEVSKSKTPERAQRLVDVLNKIGFPARIRPAPDDSRPDAVFVIVGSKPPIRDEARDISKSK